MTGTVKLYFENASYETYKRYYYKLKANYQGTKKNNRGTPAEQQRLLDLKCTGSVVVDIVSKCEGRTAKQREELWCEFLGLSDEDTKRALSQFKGAKA